MGDSEDDFDTRSRDKFRRERNDINQQRPQQQNWQKYEINNSRYSSAFHLGAMYLTISR